jgi:hypothetical protein
MAQVTIRCTYCGGTVKCNATDCHHCAAPVPPWTPPPPKPRPPTAEKEKKKDKPERLTVLGAAGWLCYLLAVVCWWVLRAVKALAGAIVSVAGTCLYILFAVLMVGGSGKTGD